jgi:hypothetical protein
MLSCFGKGCGDEERKTNAILRKGSKAISRANKEVAKRTKSLQAHQAKLNAKLDAPTETSYGDLSEELKSIQRSMRGGRGGREPGGREPGGGACVVLLATAIGMSIVGSMVA